VIVSIAQPAYLPWLGYFDRIFRSDLAVVLDHVQFERRGFTHRNRICGKNGPMWLSVPINRKGNFDMPIKDLTISNDSDWQKKHWDSIRHAYGKTACWEQYAPALEPIFRRQWTELNSLLAESTAILFELLGISTKIIYSSAMQVSGVKNELIVNICREAGATEYISGPFGRDYLEQESFAQAGIAVRFHDYRHPQYPQQQPGFVPNMSVIDLLLQHGPASLEILTRAQELAYV